MSKSSPSPTRLSHLILRLSCFVVLLAPASSARSAEDVIDSPMYKAPDLPVPRVVLTFPEEAKKLWLKALDRPETDLKCKAAEAIALAHRRGVKGLETAIVPLRAIVDQAEQPQAARLAAAQALITLDARDAAPSLFKQVQAGSSTLRNLIEPALARWDYRPAHAVWLERLNDPATPQRSLVLAIQQLAAVHEEQAADRLRELVVSRQMPGPVRLEAARALGTLRTEGLVSDAERLARETSTRGMAARLAAASLLQRHRSAEAIRLLQSLMRDPEPAVAALAVVRLIQIDSKLVVPALEQLVASPDAKLRSLGVDVLLRLPSDKHIRLLGDRLDDPSLEVRAKACRALREMAATKEFRDQAIAAAARMLATRQWRALEQATILLTQLNYKPAAGRLLELLTFNEPEVFLTAAWGLRRLDVPQTLPGVVSYVHAELKQPPSAPGHASRKDLAFAMLDHQLSQLNQFLGQRRYAPADGLLRQFIGSRTGPESRAAAIWALGLIHEGKSDTALANALEERLNDIHSYPPEDFRVRWMCAVAFGRMKAKDVLPSLRKYCPVLEPSEEPVRNACGWAITQITGEPMPAPKTIHQMQRDWFLTPHEGRIESPKG